MVTLIEFENSVNAAQPASELSIQLKSLWYDAKGDWHQAHEQVDKLTDQQSCLIHAYLHRKEGDLWNADYWYRKAGQIRPNLSLKEEWVKLVGRNLQQ